MERISALIQKLQEQLASNADAEQLLFTTQLLHAELLKSREQAAMGSSRKIAVVMPSMGGVRTRTEAVATKPAAAPVTPVATPEPSPAPMPQAAPPAPQPAEEIPAIPQPIRAETPVIPVQPPVAAAPEVETPAAVFNYNPIQEVPTLTHQLPQEERKELNDHMAAAAPVSLNDVLQKEQQPELASKLTETPIRDLRKAIGINDRYVFINELFRGDEAMYDRSVKTINNFSIYQEAYYWMERELKLKLGWNDEKHASKLFYQLVRRRFA